MAQAGGIGTGSVVKYGDLVINSAIGGLDFAILTLCRTFGGVQPPDGRVVLHHIG